MRNWVLSLEMVCGLAASGLYVGRVSYQVKFRDANFGESKEQV